MSVKPMGDSNIKTAVIFDCTGFRPVWFSLNGAKVEIKEIYYKWVERNAEEFVYKFSVSDGIDFYEISLSSFDMRWRIKAN